MKIGPLIAFKGATMFEAQIGRLWVTFLRPRFWISGSPRLIRVGIDRSDDE